MVTIPPINSRGIPFICTVSVFETLAFTAVILQMWAGGSKKIALARRTIVSLF